MRMRKTVISLLAVLLFALGGTVCAYPYMQGHERDQALQQEVDTFLLRLEETVPEETAETPVREHEDLWDRMEAYNKSLWESKQISLSDPWAYQQPSFQLGDFGFDQEVFGVLSIPKLGLEMPIYLGATEENMAKGAAHLSQTSLPIGGENTNCVIAGHRGWGASPYFRYITNLESGDEVNITNLWETLHYTVTGTDIILPNDVEKIKIQEGRDMLTLLTCHPYASGGKYRYLVFCDRATEE